MGHLLPHRKQYNSIWMSDVSVLSTIM